MLLVLMYNLIQSILVKVYDHLTDAILFNMFLTFTYAWVNHYKTPYSLLLLEGFGSLKNIFLV